MKKIIISILFINLILLAQDKTSSISSMPGAFSRMGFGARGMAMGNAMSAVVTGDLVSYYNPALTVYQIDNSVQTGYSILSLDRKLNFLSFTRRFVFGKNKKEKTNKKSRFAGISIGLINSGVNDIDKRTSEGYKTGSFSTSENQFFMALSNKFSDKVTLGLNIKYYYYDLYEDISSTALGVDLGLVYQFNQNLTFAFVIADLNSKYKWDTTDLYGQNGTSQEDKFPLMKRFGVAYKDVNNQYTFSFEWEISNANTSILKFGSEYYLVDEFALRAGLNNLNLKNSDFPVRPSFGFSYLYTLKSLLVGIEYTFVSEPYSINNIHVIGLTFKF